MTKDRGEKGSAGPLNCSEVQISAFRPELSVVDLGQSPDRSQADSASIPSETGERVVQIISRAAGPIAFLLALGSLIWLLVK